MTRTPPDALLRDLAEAVGEARLYLDPADRLAYGYDNSRRQALPAAVVLPEDADQVAACVAACARHRWPLSTRGRGTGTTGAVTPIHGEVVMSLERMDRILEIAPDDRLAVVQPGVTNQALQTALAEHGFFWPPDPTSAAFCTVGGNLAYNSAGPRAVKYGTPRENTLGLAAVDGLGRPFRCGTRTSKGVVGYDLTRLLIGSEGTLAVITEATLRLTPLPEGKRTLQAVYDDMHAAARAVARIMAQPVTPCALEFMDGAAIAMIRDYRPGALPEDAGALLMIEVDGPEAGLDAATERVAEAARVDGLMDLVHADSPERVRALWEVRRALSPALRKVAPKKINEDVAVPVSRIPALIDGLARLGEAHGITIVNFGHAGNGNIHVNLLVNPDDPEEMARAHRCLDAVFALVLDLGGTLSGEHGVGLEKRDFVDRELHPLALAHMHAIKGALDPLGILNPGKTLPPLPEGAGDGPQADGPGGS